jgi:hypothetical protein
MRRNTRQFDFGEDGLSSWVLGSPQWRENMAPDGPDGGSSLVERVETRVRDLTHGRVRGLVVEERQGRILVSGQVSSRHIKQLAFQGVLEMISGERFSEEITIG